MGFTLKNKIYLIAGHNGSGTGANGFIDEGKETIILRDLIAEKLKEMGIVAIKDDKMYNELKQTNRLLKTQKSGNFYGMPLIRQIQQGEYISQRKRGLLN